MPSPTLLERLTGSEASGKWALLGNSAMSAEYITCQDQSFQEYDWLLDALHLIVAFISRDRPITGEKSALLLGVVAEACG